MAGASVAGMASMGVALFALQAASNTARITNTKANFVFMASSSEGWIGLDYALDAFQTAKVPGSRPCITLPGLDTAAVIE